MVKTTKTSTKAPAVKPEVKKPVSIVESAVKSEVKEATVVKKVAVKSATKPMPKKAAPTKKAVVKPVVKSTSPKDAPVVKSVAKPAPKKAAPATEPVEKTAPKKVAAPKKTAKKKVVKRVAVKKTVAKKAAPAVKPAVKNVTSVATKPAVEKEVPVVNPIIKKTVKKERNIFVCYANVFKRYFDFKGRTSRYGYWSFVGVNFLISFIFGALAVCCIPYIDTVYSLLIFIPSLALSFRRLHDINKSGWAVGLATLGLFLFMILFAIVMHGYNLTGEYNPFTTIPYLIVGLAVLITLLYVFVLSFFKGTKGRNKYGDVPNV